MFYIKYELLRYIHSTIDRSLIIYTIYETHVYSTLCFQNISKINIKIFSR